MGIRFFSNELKKRKIFLCTILVVAVLGATASPAFALPYWRAGRENKSSGTSIRWTGGHAYNFVMANPNITGDHVNSIYIARIGPGYPNHYYEVGWNWRVIWDGTKYVRRSTPEWFWSKMVSGVYYGPYRTDAQANSNHLLSVQIESNGNAQMKVDSTVLRQEVSNFYPDGEIFWGSERQNTNESNFGHFWHLMKRRHDYSWVLWEDQREYSSPLASPQPDPGYHYYEASEYEGSSLAN